MTTLSVHTRSRAYDIFVGDGLLRQAGPLCREVNPRGARALIVTDSNVYPLYAGQVARSLESAGYAVSVFAFPAGEEQKRLDTIARIYAKLAEENLTRSDLLVALGGGVTGDMTGFAAATWLRGVDFVQIPTSLLAQVDSSVGGKTGVDIPQGKNLVGAFRQPARVLADLSVLDSLPPSFLTDGMAEIIKAGCSPPWKPGTPCPPPGERPPSCGPSPSSRGWSNGTRPKPGSASCSISAIPWATRWKPITTTPA